MIVYVLLGIDESTARAFVTSFYCSLAQGSTQAHESLEGKHSCPIILHADHAVCTFVVFVEMRDEAATPGGLNEQSVGFLRNSPHFDLHWEVRLS